MDKKKEYIEMYNYIKSSPSGYFSSLASKADESLNLVSTQINQIIEKLGSSDTWDDSISWTINQTTGIGIPEMIKACQEPAIAATRKIDNILAVLGQNLEKYDSSVDEYNELTSTFNKNFPSVPKGRNEDIEYLYNADGTIAVDSNGEKLIKSRTSTVNENYTKYVTQKSNIENLSNEINLTISLIENNMNQLKGILNEVGTDAFAAANSAPISTNTSEKTDTPASEYGYDDNHTVIETIQYDDNNNPVTRVYKVLDSQGNEVETGTYNYDTNGRIDAAEIYKTPEDSTVFTEEPKPQDLIDEETVPVSEKITVAVEEVETIDDLSEDLQEIVDDGMMNQAEAIAEKIDGDVVVETVVDTKEFSQLGGENSSEITHEYFGVQTEKGEGNGVNEPINDQIVLAEHAEGQITVDGETYNYEENAIYTEAGNTKEGHKEITTTAGESIWKEDETQNVEYKSEITGANVNSNDVVTEDESSVTTVSGYTMKDENGEIIAQCKTEATRSKDDPRVGVFIDDDGTKYEYSYNEEGKLVETVTTYNGGKHGEEETSEPVVVEEDWYTLTVKNPDGTTTVMNINYNSKLDMHHVDRAYEKAMEDCGYEVDRNREGIHNLYNGDGEVVVSTPWVKDREYVFNFSPKE